MVQAMGEKTWFPLHKSSEPERDVRGGGRRSFHEQN